MPDTFPGIKTLSLGPVHKNIGGMISKAKCFIPPERINGETPNIFMRTSTSYEWEECENGQEHTFNNSGTEVYVMIMGSGCSLSTRGEAGEITPAIIVKVTEIITAQSLIHLPLNNDCNDTSGNDNDGTSYGTSYGDGKIGTSAYMNNSSQYIYIPIGDVYDEFTICFWMKRHSGTNTATYFIVNFGSFQKGFWVDASDQLVLEVNDGSRKGLTRQAISSFLPVDEWVWICGTCSEGTLSLYKNNVLIDSRSDIGDTLTKYNNIGVGCGELDAYIDDLRVFDRELTLNERENIYNNGNGTEDET